MAQLKKVGVLVSGRGSNLQSLIAACKAPDYPAELVLVIANRPDAPALKRAQRARIATKVINHHDFDNREGFEEKLDEALREAKIEIVCLAGFMRILSRGFVKAWTGRMLNVHPALPSAYPGRRTHIADVVAAGRPSTYPGLRTHARALANGARIHGCTVHLVTPELDAGPVLVYRKLRVLESDDEASLANRVLVQEHRCYPLALRLLCEAWDVVEQRRVWFHLFRPPATAAVDLLKLSKLQKQARIRPPAIAAADLVKLLKLQGQPRNRPLATAVADLFKLLKLRARAWIRPPAPAPDFALCNPLPAAREVRMAGPERPAVSPG